MSSSIQRSPGLSRRRSNRTITDPITQFIRKGIKERPSESYKSDIHQFALRAANNNIDKALEALHLIKDAPDNSIDTHDQTIKERARNTIAYIQSLKTESESDAGSDGSGYQSVGAGSDGEGKTSVNQSLAMTPEVMALQRQLFPSPASYSPQKLQESDIGTLNMQLSILFPGQEAELEGVLDKLNTKESLSGEEIRFIQQLSLSLRLTGADDGLVNRLHTSMNTKVVASESKEGGDVPSPVSIVSLVNPDSLTKFMDELKVSYQEIVTMPGAAAAGGGGQARRITPLLKTIEEKWANEEMTEADLAQRPKFIEETISYIDGQGETQDYKTAYIRIQLLREELKTQDRTIDQINELDMMKIRLQHLVMDGASRQFVPAGTTHVEHAAPYAILKSRVMTLFNTINSNNELKAQFKAKYQGMGIYVERPGEDIPRPTRRLLKVLFNSKENTYFMDGLANVLKSDMPLNEFLETDDEYGPRFVQFVSGRSDYSINELIDDTAIIPRFKGGPPVRPELQGKGIGEGIRQYLYQNTELAQELFDYEQEGSRKKYLYYFAMDIVNNNQLTKEEVASITQHCMRAMNTGRTAHRNSLRGVLGEVINKYDIRSPSPHKGRTAKNLRLSMGGTPQTPVTTSRLEQQALKSELEEATSHNALLEEQLSEQGDQITELIAGMKQKDTQIAELIAGMKALKADNTKKDAQIAKRDAQIEQLTGEVSQLKDMLRQIMQQNQE